MPVARSLDITTCSLGTVQNIRYVHVWVIVRSGQQQNGVLLKSACHTRDSQVASTPTRELNDQNKGIKKS